MDYSHDMFYDYDLYGKPLLDYTPDLIPNEPSDEHHLDDLYMPPLTASSASPAPPSSYLQYLQNSNNEWMQQQPALDSSDLSYMLDPALFSNEWLLYDELPKNDPAHPPASSNNSNHAAASAAAAAAALDPASWLAQGPLEQMSALDAGGMTREYVSLSDVNSFVAQADSQKQAASVHLSYSTPENLHALLSNDYYPTHHHVAAQAAAQAAQQAVQQAVQQANTLPARYDEDEDFSDTSSSTYSNTNNSLLPPLPVVELPRRQRRQHRLKKYHSDIFLSRHQKKAQPQHQHQQQQQQQQLSHPPSRMPAASESISSFLARQHLSDDDYEEDHPLHRPHHHPHHPHHHDEDDEDDDEDEEDDEVDDADLDDDDDDEEDDFRLATATTMPATSLRKGRNVDKACNHCKRSHLRCDNMRPCRRCVATGKSGCKDVEHKPRGRPRLNKNSVKKD